MAPKIVQLSSERYSSELLRNRLSDLCGVVRTAWDWLSWVVQILVLVGVTWYTFTDSRDTAVYAWAVIPLIAFFWVVSMVFSLACKVLTGRYPGQAKAARKSLAEYIANKPHG